MNDWKEFNEEEFRFDTDTDELTINEVVDEAIATLINSYELEDEGFRRVEKVSLLAIYYLKQRIDKALELLETRFNKSWYVFHDELQETLKGDKNE